jgi:glycosyltransferase involved in cell wall biosynthesis
VVATRISAVPELIRHGETGLLVEPGDPEALRRALVALVSDPAATRRRAEAGRSLVERDHDARRSGASLVELFLGLPRA